MKSIIHYRVNDLVYSTSRLPDDFIIQAVVEGFFHKLVDVRPYEYEMDNQKDYIDESEDDAYVNLYLIIDLHGEEITQENKFRPTEIYFLNRNIAPPKVMQYWTAGKEQFYIIECDEKNPKLEMYLNDGDAYYNGD